MIETQNQLENRASDIKNEVNDKANTATRVGAMLLNFVQSVYNALSNKVDKITGKGLSENDYTTPEKNKLASLSNYDDSVILQELANKTEQADIDNAIDALKGGVAVDGDTLAKLRALIATNITNIAGKVEQTDINNAINALKEGVPAEGDTLNKLYTLITNLQTIVASDDINYDTLQEIVNFIKTIDTDGELVAAIDTAVGHNGWRTQATSLALGLVKLYDALGTNTDGTMTQAALQTEFDKAKQIEKDFEVAPDLDTVIRNYKVKTPVQLLVTLFDGVTTISYRTKLDDGIDTFTDRADLNALNTYLAGLANDIPVEIEATTNATKLTLVRFIEQR